MAIHDFVVDFTVEHLALQRLTEIAVGELR